MIMIMMLMMFLIMIIMIMLMMIADPDDVDRLNACNIKLMMTATVMTKRAKILKLDLNLTKLYHHNYDFHPQNFQGIASLLWFYSPRPTRFNSGENLMG